MRPTRKLDERAEQGAAQRNLNGEHHQDEQDSKVKFDPAHKFAARAVAVIQEHGVILRALPGDIIGFCPPLVINGDELDDMFDRVEAALDDFTATAESLR